MRSRPAALRVLVDTNLWISYLLPSSTNERTVDRLVDLVVEGEVTLIVPVDVIHEIRETVLNKPRLSRRISPEDLQVLIEVLEAVGEVARELPGPIPPVTRDPKDDYLLAHAVLEDVDILISGDYDLLSHRSLIDRPRIMTASEFVNLFTDA